MTHLKIPVKAKTNAKNSKSGSEAGSTTKKQLATATMVALFSSATSFAAPPVPYGDWTVTNGMIDTTAPVTAPAVPTPIPLVGSGGATAPCGNFGAACTELAPSEAGFKYEKVESDGSTFLRLILTEASATGDSSTLDFSVETYIPFAIVNRGIAQGVASKQIVRDPAANLDLVAEVQTGNMRSLYATTAEDLYTTKIAQSLSSAGADFNSSFSFTNYTAFSTDPGSNNPDTSNVIGRKLEISQNTLVGEAGDTSKKQTFVQRQVSGYAGNTIYNPWPGSPPGLKTKFLVNGTTYFIKSPLTTAGSITLPDTSNGKLATAGTSSTVSWAAGEDISTTWVAQSSNSPTNPTGVDMNYQNVINNTTAIEASATLLELIPPSADPFAWDPNFGTAPPSL